MYNGQLRITVQIILDMNELYFRTNLFTLIEQFPKNEELIDFSIYFLSLSNNLHYSGYHGKMITDSFLDSIVWDFQRILDAYIDVKRFHSIGVDVYKVDIL